MRGIAQSLLCSGDKCKNDMLIKIIEGRKKGQGDGRQMKAWIIKLRLTHNLPKYVFPYLSCRLVDSGGIPARPRSQGIHKDFHKFKLY